MKVLIVDDHALFRQGLASLLTSEPDFDVVGEAASIKKAVELANQLKPDMVLMDFELPDGNGAEASREILKFNPDCMIVFLTMYADDGMLIDSVRSGAVGYLLKDRPIDDLLCSLRSVARGEAAISRTMTRRILEELAFPGNGSSADKDAFVKLTEREKDILRELSNGSSNWGIASKLFISENTVKHHLHSIYKKLAVDNRRAAAEYARKYGLK